jgi:[histone H3]-lysine9 N-trimethyltransferase SUV39H
MQLQNLWTGKAEQRGAAPISFCNDIDDEAIPSIGPNFCYLEDSYKLLSLKNNIFVMTFSDVYLFYNSAPGVRKPSDDFLVTCSCHECVDVTTCSCQDASEIVDDEGNRIFAYTRSVGFRFIFFYLTLYPTDGFRAFLISVSLLEQKLLSVIK